MNPVVMRFVEHGRQRYDTAGDWYESSEHDHPITLLSISTLKDWRYMVLIAVHELVEWAICKHQGVTEQQVDAFDLAWKGRGEPGDAPYAPYHKAHVIANKIERTLATALDVEWKSYDAAIKRLKWKRDQ